MPETSYIIAVLATVFIITFALRALPFAALKMLRESKIVKVLSWWMPIGILGIHAGLALVAVITTAVTHLLFGRRTLVSVGVGTVTYVLMVNLL